MERDFSPEFKFSLELEGEKRISASALFELLEKIKSLGSISAASSSLGLSYRYSWGLLREAEKSLGVALVEKQAGGYAGGGTSLTEDGQELLSQYRNFKKEVNSGLSRFFSTFAFSTESASHLEESDLKKAAQKNLLLASTMEPVETGLLDLLEQVFFQVSGILVRHIALGSGKALQMAKEGRVDMVLTHAPDLENTFMQEGWGKERIPLMSNDFVITGPESDPAEVRTLKAEEGVIAAFRCIAHAQAPFISRGDYSGTHLKELKLWEAAGVKPEGEWYIQSPSVAGNMGILQLSKEKRAYTLVDRASFIISDTEGEMTVFVENEQEPGDNKELENIFSLILISPESIPTVKYRESSLFARWLKKEGQEIISKFGQDNFNKPLFSTIP